MSKKIVICPSFASAHFIKCHIPNLLEVIEPDSIIYKEGLFPRGPENKGHVDINEFREKYCDENFMSAGFDFNELRLLLSQYPNLKLHKIDYPADATADQCFLQCMSSFGIDGDSFSPIQPEVGDIIFPLEPDAFHHENDKDKIQEAISKLKPGEGLQTKWVDFLETQYYTEAINIEQPKWRRFCYCFDNMENYLSAINGFMSQSYPKLKKTTEFITYHYPWFVYDKYKSLRYELIHRSDPQYWKDFETGLREIRRESEDNVLLDGSLIVIRPSRRDAGRYAKFIDIDHPAAIKEHPNYVK